MEEEIRQPQDVLQREEVRKMRDRQGNLAHQGPRRNFQRQVEYSWTCPSIQSSIEEMQPVLKRSTLHQRARRRAAEYSERTGEEVPTSEQIRPRSGEEERYLTSHLT